MKGCCTKAIELHFSTVSLVLGVHDRRSTHFIIFLLFLIGPAISTAQEKQVDSVELQEFEVLEDKNTVPAPFKKTVYGKEELSSHTGEDMGTFLRDNAPVHIKSYGPGLLSSPSFRGTNANHTRVYWNGIPVNSPTLGQTDLSTLPVGMTESLELHHGTSSLADGTGGLGGSLQLTEGPNWQKSPSGRISFGQGSFGDYFGNVGFQTSNGRVNSSTQALYQQRENDFTFSDVGREGAPLDTMEHAALRQYGIKQELYGKLNSKNQVSARVWYVNTEQEIPRTLAMQRSEQYQDTEAFRSMLGWTRTGDNSVLSFNSAYFREGLNYVDSLSSIRSEVITNSFRNRLNYSYRLGADIRARGGLLFDHDQALSPGFEGKQTRNKWGAFGGIEKNFFDRLIVDFSFRQVGLASRFLPFLPSIGSDLLVLESPNLHWKANWSRNSRIPTMNELYWEPGGNPELDSETGWSAETGLLFESTSSTQMNFETEATAYYSRIRDWIQWVPTDQGYWAPRNLRMVRTQGVEWSGKGTFTLFEDWKIFTSLNYSYTLSQNREEEIDRQLIYVPFHQGKGSLSIHWREHTWIGGHFQYTGKRFIQEDNSSYLPAYYLTKIQAGRSISLGETKALKIKGEIRNIFDIEYQSIAWRPMPGRSYFISINYRFGP